MHTTLHLCRLQVVCFKNSKLKRAADALGWRADTIKQMNSEAVNAICKLCKRRIAANHQFILEHLRPYFFCARLIPIAKKDGGIIRPIAIGTIFHKFISSAIMYNLKEKLPGIFSLCSLVWACQEVLRENIQCMESETS